MQFAIRAYVTPDGTCPYREWLMALDRVTAAIVLRRVERLKLGNFGDVKPIGGGLSELRIHYGPGYRIYFGQAGKEVILLLCGSDKSDQRKAIARATDLWGQFKEGMQDANS